MEPSLEELLQQALRDGNTPAAAALGRAIEGRIELARSVTGIQTIKSAAIPVQAQVAGRVVKNTKKEKFNLIQFAFSWKMAVLALYIAIAEVLNPGHQGLLKLNQIHWFWGPRTIAGMVNIELPKINVPEIKIPEVAQEISVGEAEVKVSGVPEAPGKTLYAPDTVMVECDRNKDNGEFVKFTINAADFTITQLASCDRGVREAGKSIATLTDESLVSVEEKDAISNYTQEDLTKAGLLK